MNAHFKKTQSRIFGSIERSIQYLEPRFLLSCFIAIIGFPLYYFVWHDLFPQPYENLPLRIIGSLIFIPLLFTKRWPERAHAYLPMYWYFAILYTTSFFFTFMLLKNNGSVVWLLSSLTALFLMVLLLDWLNLIIQFSLGVGLGAFAYYITTDSPQWGTVYLEHLPIYLFALAVGSVANYSSEMVKQEQRRVTLATASNIAHELRTPLLGIKSGAAGLRQYLPVLLEAYRLARDNKLPVASIRTIHLNSIQGVLDRIEQEAAFSNTVIDMLLMNARSFGLKPADFSFCSMAKCVEKALSRYPFASEKEKSLIVWNNNADFTFHGSELLIVHVLFNLLKNSIFYVAQAGKGQIFIRIEPSPHGNKLYFRDTGTGIPPEVLPYIFTRFYSWSAPGGSLHGTGIGLAFCLDVMQTLHGAIECQTKLGEFTEFTLTFPTDNVL